MTVPFKAPAQLDPSIHSQLDPSRRFVRRICLRQKQELLER